ncbi:MAG: hypothetical protein JSS34_06625 [Proteobacteria bacterium]|nr:hypothetical protein [Pseudomonadota bacterium]
MKKLILGSCLVAGTSVGAGMIALPMALCKIGIFPTIVLILGLWIFMYLTGLLGLELNLKRGKGQTLAELGNFYRGSFTSLLGSLCLMFLIYALLCAYLYGGASIFQGFFEAHLGCSLSLQHIVLIYAFTLCGIFSLSVSWILQINKILLSALLGTFGLLIVGFFTKINLLHMPLLTSSFLDLNAWTLALPILSTAFGFHVILPILTNYCDKDPLLLKRCVFWGSLIPAFVYILWTITTLAILYHAAPQKYALLLLGKLDVGQFVQALTETTAWPLVQTVANAMSMIAILKSSIGVGLALFEFWQEKLLKHFPSSALKTKGSSIALTIFPSLGFALFVPSLFIKALSFAGMINVGIIILLPLWLLTSQKAEALPSYYPLMKTKFIKISFLILGFTIILCEVINMI